MNFVTAVSFLAVAVLACEDCSGPRSDGAQSRIVRRMQPGALNATGDHFAPLEWGQLNFLHTTDTHGWLEGHLKEQNYGADWGDYASFTMHMKQKADNLGVDLLLIDTGDLHDGAGLSDATQPINQPNGHLSNQIFEKIDYDLLTIGNHELGAPDVAYDTFVNFAKKYGEKYLTSNVQILNTTSTKLEYIGSKYRYFTTKRGLRIMSFGILYDFKPPKQVNVTVTGATELVGQDWFLKAVEENASRPIDLFLVIGHNPVRNSTFKQIFDKIHELRPNTPIQFFGGHTHTRDFVVYNENSTGLESGRFCETLGWLSMNGIQSSTFNGTMKPLNVSHPTQKAVIMSHTTNSAATSTPSLANVRSSDLNYSRRYLDWNRMTFAYHAVGSQDFDTFDGLRISEDINKTRTSLDLTRVYGCAPQTYCVDCAPFNSTKSIYSLVKTALVDIVINQNRPSHTKRLLFTNTAGIRFDLVQGPFTYDDQFIVSPFNDSFRYIADVPYQIANQVLKKINNVTATPNLRRRDLETKDFNFGPLTDVCLDGDSLKARSVPMPRGLQSRQYGKLTPGYVTKDDFGDKGDDTQHNKIKVEENQRTVPKNLQAASFNQSSLPLPNVVDVIFTIHIQKNISDAISDLNKTYWATVTVTDYLPPATMNAITYLPEYVKKHWKLNGTCTVGEGVPVGS